MDDFLMGPRGVKQKLKKRGMPDIEPHEALLDRLAQSQEGEIGLSDKKFEVPLSGRTLNMFLILCAVLLVFLFGKTFQMQIISGKNYVALANDNKFAVSQIQSERGVIYDKSMNQLVYNKPSFDLVLNKSNLPQGKKDSAVNEVAQILGQNPADIESKMSGSPDNLVTISQDIDHQSLIVLETKMNELPGFEIDQNWTRQYVSPSSSNPTGNNYFADILGYTGRITPAELASSTGYLPSDYVGKAGLEKSYEGVLKKDPGELQITRNALGEELSEKVIEQPKSGDSLVLWLDSGLQEKITNTLESIAKNLGVTNAAAVALDPKTGGVLSLVSVPTFNNNLFSAGANQQSLGALIQGNLPGQSLYNLAIAGQFPSGSTIKPLIASGVLQENIIPPDKQIYCGPSIAIPNPWDPSHPTIKRDWATHGWTDMRKAIAESSDVYFYTVGGGFGSQKGLGVANIDKYLNLFGWGQTTGIDIPGETAGLVPSPAWMKSARGESWTDGDTYNITIGQGDMLVTPVQMAASYVPIANGGTLYKPEIVQKIVDSNKNPVKSISPQIVRNDFISPQNLEVVRQGMRDAVTGQGAPLASATMLNSLPITVAAKTGTAETGKYVGGVELLDNWISLFAPYNNPQIVLTIMFQNVAGEQSATLPAAKDILNWYFTQDVGTSTNSGATQ